MNPYPESVNELIRLSEAGEKMSLSAAVRCADNWATYKDRLGRAASQMVSRDSYGTALPMHVALEAVFAACEFARDNGFRYDPKEGG